MYYVYLFISEEWVGGCTSQGADCWRISPSTTWVLGICLMFPASAFTGWALSPALRTSFKRRIAVKRVDVLHLIKDIQIIDAAAGI